MCGVREKDNIRNEHVRNFLKVALSSKKGHWEREKKYGKRRGERLGGSRKAQ